MCQGLDFFSFENFRSETFFARFAHRTSAPHDHLASLGEGNGCEKKKGQGGKGGEKGEEGKE